MGLLATSKIRAPEYFPPCSRPPSPRPALPRGGEWRQRVVDEPLGPEFHHRLNDGVLF